MNNDSQAPQNHQPPQVPTQPPVTSAPNPVVPTPNPTAPRKWPLASEWPAYLIIMAVVFPVGVMTSTIIENTVSESASTIFDLVLMLYFVVLMIVGTVYVRNYRKKQR